MNDLPERIWALECMDGNLWSEPADEFHLYTEYVRADKYAELEEQLMFFLEDWGECTELGFCPELGYADEDWCPWCKTRMLLGLPIARNTRS
jgi:hypothetical protein